MLVSILSGSRECHVGLAGFELHDAADVSGGDGGNFLLLVTSDGIDGGQTLAVAGLRVDKVSALFKDTAHHLEIRHITEVLLDSGLVDEDADRACGVALDLSTADGLVGLTFG